MERRAGEVIDDYDPPPLTRRLSQPSRLIRLSRLLLNPNPSLGSFGLAPPQAKTFLASSLLAFLETDTEAYAYVAVTGGAVVAPS